MGDVLSVAVVSGGIGGLAVALSLHRAGFDVRVYEQTGSVSEIGAAATPLPEAADEARARPETLRARLGRLSVEQRSVLRETLAESVSS